MKSPQAPASVVVIRPHHFTPNPQTRFDNAFQQEIGASGDAVAKRAYAEVTGVIEQLRDAGIECHVFEDQGWETPDSVFPNNWFSTHPGGHVALYPMYAPNRRKERRHDIVEMLKREYRVQDVIDYSGLEYDDLFLEGTGAMVLDHITNVAYVIRSKRADPVMLERFCTHFRYEPMAFDAADSDGSVVYHTNVLMCIATEFVMIADEMITDKERAAMIRKRLLAPGRIMISLKSEQISKFAGNCLELQAGSNRRLVMSKTARSTLSDSQIDEISKSAEPLIIDIPTIELAGGSVRCMLAGIHLDRREQS